MWMKGDLQSDNTETFSNFPPPLTLTSESSPLQFFQLFLSPDILTDLVKHSVVYASKKNKLNFELCLDEMYVFIGILVLSGYVPLPRRRMYWEESEDVHNELVAKSMRRNRFEEISSVFHAADNDNLPEGDKLGRIRPFIEAINKNFIKYAPIESNISIDEAMIPYYGRHGCKQYIRGKPIRFGYKAWVAALKCGYCLQFDIYQGRKQNIENLGGVGLGERVVTSFATLLEKEFPNLRFTFYFDNSFTSAKLIICLGKKGFGATGTVRENRTDECPLKNSTLMKKMEIGSMDVAVGENNKIAGIRWKDNSIVTLLSNVHGLDPL
ncbi:unnamed protein product [Acanthoscelides obtectus]|uniref:PiggyBac transposable element-derived protein domain-containing protein n=1 Tax=Acanthoscelides obtectus TaxID=200917 RepID=A0A9P0LXN0_ACAOB|nr:unnamed protein product [Acanthoscelides obtectus]CAK1635796.1 PiggyBac transposable element-derived protein 3 [Acanthoscelides obtectus]